MLGTSLAQTVRAVEKAIDRHERGQLAPRVMWALIGEDAECFAARCAEIRARWSGRILAAVPFGMAVPDGVQAVPFAPKFFALLHPDHPIRYRMAGGGRGSGKSRAIATAIILECVSGSRRVLCAREFQRSLRESATHLLADTIRGLKLEGCFDIHESEINSLINRSEIIFGGLGVNAQSLLSLENVDRVWIEQGESISARSLELLVPTIRAPGSEIWISYNPDAADAPVMQLAEAKRPDVRHCHTTYLDNPWWRQTSLENERVQLLRVDPDAHSHIYLGTTRIHSKAQVFAGKYSIEEFEPVIAPYGVPRPANSPRAWVGPYLGADWGFAVDPVVLVMCWVKLLGDVTYPVYEEGVQHFGNPWRHTGPRELYVEYESSGVGVDLNNTPQLFDLVPGARDHTIRADSARPESISYMQKHGYRKMIAARKWRNCVEDGVAYMRGFERIVLHPRCTRAAEEFRLYSFKTDRLTGDVLPDLQDKHNHVIDALRYALDPVMKSYSTTVRPLMI
jgi:phage terminase large subunit